MGKRLEIIIVPVYIVIQIQIVIRQIKTIFCQKIMNMEVKMTQFKQISKFLSSFSILQHSEGTTVIASENSTYLIRNIEISNVSGKQKAQELNEIIKTLSQHQSFNSKNILSLVDFQIIFNKNKTQSQIRAVYEYGKKSLSKQIQDRKQSQEHFDQEALWGLLYSIASPLAYLQERNIIYGVIDPSRVFLDKNIIAILDPSSTGIDPYQITPNRLYSPQLLTEQKCPQQIDMFKSDVYVLGLLMLQCALLKMELYEYDQNVITICLTEIKDVYSQNLCQIIESMLDQNPLNRPSFDQLLKSISNLFDISTSEIQNLQPMCPDKENETNQVCQLDEYSQRENIDILQTEYIRSDQDHYYSPSITDFQKAKTKFYAHKDFHLNESPISESSEYSETSSLFIEDSLVKSFEKSKRIYKPKQIKDRLVKKDFVYHSERQRQQDIANLHRRSKTHWQQERSDNKHTGFESKRDMNEGQTKRKEFSKENNFSQNNFSYGGSCSALNKQNLYTKPEIIDMIKNSRKEIQQRKKSGLSVHFSYFTNQGKIKTQNAPIHQTLISSKKRY